MVPTAGLRGEPGSLRLRHSRGPSPSPQPRSQAPPNPLSRQDWTESPSHRNRLRLEMSPLPAVTWARPFHRCRPRGHLLRGGRA